MGNREEGDTMNLLEAIIFGVPTICKECEREVDKVCPDGLCRECHNRRAREWWRENRGKR